MLSKDSLYTVFGTRRSWPIIVVSVVESVPSSTSCVCLWLRVVGHWRRIKDIIGRRCLLGLSLLLPHEFSIDLPVSGHFIHKLIQFILEAARTPIISHLSLQLLNLPLQLRYFLHLFFLFLLIIIGFSHCPPSPIFSRSVLEGRLSLEEKTSFYLLLKTF